MYAVLGSVVDALHALLMAAWALGLPLLFWRRFPRVSRAYAVYAVGFVLVNQVSRVLLGECVLTTVARRLWEAGGAPARSTPSEWFTVRLAAAIFHASPSHGAITVVGEMLVLVTAIGVWHSMRAPASRTV